MDILLICLFIFLHVNLIKNSPVDNSNIQQAEKDEKITETLFKWSNFSVDPCDNFYKFVCGAAKNRSDYKSIASTIQDDNRNIRAKLMMEDGIIKSDDPKYVKLLKNYYKSCVDEFEPVKKKFAVMMKLIKESGGWPLLEGDNWNEDHFDWIESARKLKKRGLFANSFIKINLQLNDNRSKLLLSIERPTEILDLNTKQMRKVLSESFKDKISLKKINETLDSIQNLTSELLSVSGGLNFYYKSLKIFPLKYLSIEFPISIPWVEYVNKFLPEEVSVDDDEIVYAMNPTYIKHLEGILNRTSKRVQADYLMTVAFYQSADFILREPSDDPGVNHVKCVEEMFSISKVIPFFEDNLLGLVGGGALFAKRFSNETVKERVTEMFHNIKNEVVHLINSSDWLDVETKMKAIEKGNAMTAIISHPKELYNDTLIDKFFEGLELSNHNYFQNHLNLKLFTWKKMYSIVNEESNFKPIKWLIYAHTTIYNAYYLIKFNQIVMLSTFIQKPQFNKDWPEYVNYASIGYVIGYELFRGFDSQGIRFDKNGNNYNWWSQKTRKTYKEKMKCLINQYNNFTVDEIGINVNGRRSTNRNLDDNVGVKAAYLAAKKLMIQTKVKNIKYKSRDFTPEQIYWIGFTHSFCDNYSDLDELKEKLKMEPRPSQEFRVIGSVINTPQFAQDFHCAVGSKMNPPTQQKCIIF